MKWLIISVFLLSTILTTSLLAEAPVITNTLSMQEMKKLIASDAATDDYFGISVAIDGNTAVVGAHQENSGQGSAYVYQFNPLNGQYEQQAKLIASDPEGSERLGTSVAISGDTIVVGAYQGDNFDGTVYLYVKPGTGWVTTGETAELNASDGNFTDYFGASVAIDGDTVVVGAQQDDGSGENSGIAYVFTKPPAGWTSKNEDAQLSASDAASSDSFGRSVAIDGDIVVVGAPGHSDGGLNTDSGAAYIFEKPVGGWGNNTENAKLLPSPAPAGNIYMGSSIDISGDTIVVGAEDDDGGNINSGSVYLFEKPVGGWSSKTEDAKLISSDAMLNDRFGVSVSVSGDRVVVGAYDYNDPADFGSAYLFKKPIAGWSNTDEDIKFIASDEVAGNSYGCSVNISGDTIIIGAFGSDDNGTNSGSAYLIKDTIVTHVVENKSDAIDVDANDVDIGDTISYSIIGGEDASLFTINTTTGLVQFKNAPDYETPLDADNDNIYKAVVMVEDDIGEYTYNPLILPVSDLEYEGESLSSKNLDEIQNVIGSSTLAWDQFGYAVAVEGNFLVAGAPDNDLMGNDRGSVYLFEYNTTSNSYEEVAYLDIASNGTENHSGISVAISGDTVVVGAYGTDDNGTDSGSAYVFEKPLGGWISKVRDARLIASDAAAYDNFGNSIAISGDTVVVGAIGDDNLGGIDAGAVYVFEKPLSGWSDKTEDAKLTASDAAESDVFGNSVSFSADTIVVGAYNNDDNGTNSGSAYIFEKPVLGWRNNTENAKLTASDAAMYDNFGMSVSINADTVVVGADGDADHSGAAYIFVKPLSGWETKNEDAKLTPLVPATWKYFGNRVAISGDTVVVGAYGDEDGGVSSGAAYLFEKPVAGWSSKNEESKLTASDAAEYDYFGGSIAISGDTVVVGAYYNNSAAGSAYIFKEGSSMVIAPLIMYLLN